MMLRAYYSATTLLVLLAVLAGAGSVLGQPATVNNYAAEVRIYRLIRGSKVLYSHFTEVFRRPNMLRRNVFIPEKSVLVRNHEGIYYVRHDLKAVFAGSIEAIEPVLLHEPSSMAEKGNLTRRTRMGKSVIMGLECEVVEEEYKHDSETTISKLWLAEYELIVRGETYINGALEAIMEVTGLRFNANPPPRDFERPKETSEYRLFRIPRDPAKLGSLLALYHSKGLEQLGWRHVPNREFLQFTQSFNFLFPLYVPTGYGPVMMSVQPAGEVVQAFVNKSTGHSVIIVQKAHTSTGGQGAGCHEVMEVVGRKMVVRSHEQPFPWNSLTWTERGIDITVLMTEVLGDDDLKEVIINLRPVDELYDPQPALKALQSVMPFKLFWPRDQSMSRSEVTILFRNKHSVTLDPNLPRYVQEAVEINWLTKGVTIRQTQAPDKIIERRGAVAVQLKGYRAFLYRFSGGLKVLEVYTPTTLIEIMGQVPDNNLLNIAQSLEQTEE